MSNTFGATERLVTMAQWWQSAEGVRLWQEESAALESWLARCFGYHALHLSLQPLAQSAVADVRSVPPTLLDGLRIPHVFQLGPLGGEVRARFESLPLEAESVDLVVAQHVLEFASEPHAVLRELDRVLVPEGRVVLLSFNPMSYWGVRRLFNLNHQAPWFGLGLGRKRLRDWLALLGYDVEDELWVGHGCLSHAPPYIAGSMQRWLARLLPRSGVGYALLARKRVSMPASIRHRWRLIPSLGVAPAGQAVGSSVHQVKRSPRDAVDGCSQ
jgi:SAM-dependent methyltransferase